MICSTGGFSIRSWQCQDYPQQARLDLRSYILQIVNVVCPYLRCC